MLTCRHDLLLTTLTLKPSLDDIERVQDASDVIGHKGGHSAFFALEADVFLRHAKVLLAI